MCMVRVYHVVGTICGRDGDGGEGLGEADVSSRSRRR